MKIPGTGVNKTTLLDHLDFGQIIQNFADAFCIEINGEIIYANEPFIALFGNQVSSIVDTIANDHRIIFRNKLSDFYNYGIKNLCLETHALDLNGKPLDVEISFTLFKNGNQIGYFILVHDFTNKKHAERQEREEKKLAQALRDTISALNSTLIFDEVIDKIFEGLMKVLPFYTSNIMLIDDDGIFARIVASRGYTERFLDIRIEDIILPIKDTATLYKMFTTGESLSIQDTKTDGEWIPNPLTSWIRSYAGAPIRVKDKVIGFLNLNSPNPYFYNKDQADRLQTFSDQIGIAINNVKLISELQNSNKELKSAYDTTLNGWSKALEMRDFETQDHCKRVVDMTVKMAARLNIRELDVDNWRYGALLHDIGKIGIPDSILKKRGPLTQKQWSKMRLHPDYAYELLNQIPYLEAAIDIPYCHHEKWDGTGYPRGLKEEEIPLSARVFSIIDVWDAMLNERRYHEPRPKKEVISYIKDQSGKQFDPKLVNIFFNLVKIH